MSLREVRAQLALGRYLKVDSETMPTRTPLSDDDVVVLIGHRPPFGEVTDGDGRIRMAMATVKNVVNGDVVQGEMDNAVRHVGQLFRQVFATAGPADGEADNGRHEQDVAEHHQDQEGEHHLVDDAGIP